MTNWDIDEYDFNTEHETVNFGTRNLADGDNLYESSTLAIFKSSEENPINTKQFIKASINRGRFFCSTNRGMKIFDDMHCTNLNFTGVFDDIIDTFAVSPDGEYLLVCLRSGLVHCIHIKKQNQIIFTAPLTDRSEHVTSLFIDCYCRELLNQTDFLTVTNKGTIFRISIKKPCETEADEASTISTDLVFDFNFNIQTAALSYPFLFVNGDDMCVYNLENEDLICCDSYNLIRVFPFNQLFIALDNIGQLIRICSRTLLICHVNNKVFYKDFFLLKEDTKCFSSNILVVTQEDDNGHSYLQLLKYKDFSVIYSLKLSGIVHLVQPEFVHDENMFISEVTNGHCINELRVQVMYETLPEKRLKRLLRKRLFDEAEKFAGLFQLDKNIIKKAKAELIVDKNVINSNEVDELLGLLDIIKDNTFSLECCYNMYYSCNEMKDVKKILNYGCLSAQSITNQAADNKILTIRSCMYELSHRFDTFLTLMHSNCSAFDNEEWLDFSQCDLLERMISKLKNHSIEETLIIYARLNRETVYSLTNQTIENILMILNNLPLNMCTTFLSSFVPLTLSHLPSSMQVFIDWLQSRIFYIEQKNKTGFPENAIELLQQFSLFIKLDSDVCNNQWNVLSDLLKALKEMQILRNNYNITITLTDYMKGPQSLLITLLGMDNINFTDDSYDNFLQQYVCKIILDNNMVPDEVFLKSIEDIVIYDEICWIRTVPSLLKCIHSVEKKLEATLFILNAAELPWAASIQKIARDCLLYTHPLVNEIQKKIDNEPKLLVLSRPVYKFNNQFSDIMEDLRFLISRIMYCQEPTMVEDIYCLCKNNNEKHIANMLLIENYITKGKLSEAIVVLDQNLPEETQKCCNELETSIMMTMDDKYLFKIHGKQYYDIAGMVYKKLKSFATSNFTVSCFDMTLHNIRSIYKIHSTFNKRIKIKDLLNHNGKEMLLTELIDCVIQKFNDKCADLTECLGLCKLISHYLLVDYDNVLIKFGNALGDFEVIKNIANDVYKNSFNSKNLCLTALLILKCIGSNVCESNALLLNNTLSNSIYVENDITSVLNGLKIADKLVVKAITCSANDLCACMEVMIWIQTTFYTVRSQTLRSNSIFDMSPTNKTFEIISRVLTMYIQFVGISNKPDMLYLGDFIGNLPKIDQQEVVPQINELPLTIHELCSQGQHFTAYRLITTFQNSLVHSSNFNDGINKQLNNIIINQCTPYLLQNILSAKEIDKDMAFNLLLSYDIEQAKNVVKQYLEVHKRNVIKFKTIAEIAIRLYTFHNVKCASLWIIIYQAKWWMKLTNCKMSYEKFFKAPPKVLVQKLLVLNQLNVNLLPEFCNDFCLDVQFYYIAYLKCSLLYWKPDYEIITDNNGQRKLVMKNDETELLRQCEEIIIEIEDKQNVINIINELWIIINFYYYEVFLCMLEILSKLNKEVKYNKQFLLFKFLKSYVRVNKPSEHEEETWYTTFPDTQKVDALSEFRFPYTQVLFTKNIWDLVKSEINLRTYKLWFIPIDIFKDLNKDDICSYVIRDVVSSRILQLGCDNEWVFYPKHEFLFHEVETCLQNMTDFEKASAVIYHLLKYTPKGADQVNAAKLCYKYSLKYKDNSKPSRDIDKAVVKVHNTYLNYSAMHILHVNHLADPPYLELALKPLQLIEELYMDRRILQKADNIIAHCPDVNKAVNNLGELFNIDVHATRMKLLKNWLSESDIPNINNLVETSASKIDSNNLKRAAYLCTENIPFWQEYLISIGLDSYPSNPIRYKARALKCFCAISDDNTIYSSTKQSREMLLNYIKKLFIISDLEHVGLNLEVESLDSQDKITLIRRLAQYKTTLSIKIISSLCIVYDIYHMAFWKLILTSAVDLNMIDELKEYTLFLKNNLLFNQKDFYVNAWQKVLDSSFELCYRYGNESLQTKCIEVILDIQSCPVLHSLNFESAVDMCLRFNLPQIAVLLMQYLDAKKQAVIRQQLQNFDINDITKDLDILEQRGLWGVKFVRNYVNNM